VDKIVFDVGITTGHAIRNLHAGIPALEAGPSYQTDNGNGSLMRVLPLALWHPGTDAELVRDAQLQSKVTHGHLRSQVCCALYCLWARYHLQEGAGDPWIRAVEALREIYADDEAATMELEHSLRPDDFSEGAGSGYVVDCLRSARWAAQEKTYETAVRRAIALGNDTDTTACVTGGIVGIREGLDGIPARWREALRGKEWLEPLRSALIAAISER
jgi:ADP-ribosylglycohydrolase